MDKNSSVLYLSYDGMTDPLGQSQVLAYLRPMSEQGVEFNIISFEKSFFFKTKRQVIEKLIEGKKINWHPLLYTKKPPIISTVKDIYNGWQLLKSLYKKQHFDIVHCRGYIGAIMGLMAKRKYGSKFIFDMRGFFPNEKKESGYWQGSMYQPVYKYFKYKEKQFFNESDFTISLTHAGKEEIEKTFKLPGSKMAVIPTCVDFNVFKPFDSSLRKTVREELNIPQDAIVLLYSGSVGPNYRLDIIFNVFKKLCKLRGNCYLLIISHTDITEIKAEIKKADLNEGNIRIMSSDYANVYRYLMAGDFGIIMYDKSYSALGRSPTKLAEYWACGLPFISRKGIGDLDYIIDKYPKGGVLMETIDTNGIDAALKKLLNAYYDKEVLRKYAIEYFELQNGVSSYLTIYNDLTKTTIAK